MIAATRRWFRRNRTNFVVGAGIIGAGYLAGQYVLGRIREASQRMVEDRASKENLRRRFQQNQGDCTYTVLALLPTVRDEIIGALPVEQITEQLQQERQERLKRLAASEAASSEYPSAPPSIVDDASTASYVHASQLVEDRPRRSKAQLWQDMKINSIARALSLLYTTALLTLLTRVQLNLLGRRTYLSSVVSMASPQPMQSSIISLEDHDGSFETVYGNDFETNRMYLTFSWWLLHRGAKSILERVMGAVKEVFGQVNIREDMSIERLSELIIDIRRSVEGATEDERRKKSWLEFLLPPREQELFVIHQAGLSDGSASASPEPGQNPMEVDAVTPSLRRLLDETADLIESPTFAQVLSHLLDAGFSHLVDVRIASEAFKAAIPEGRITEITDFKCKLAHILPVFCRQAHAIVVGSGELDAIAGVASSEAVPNEYLALMDQVHDLEAFAAVIYSSNFEYEVVDSPEPETASLQQSIISLRDSQPFALDSATVEQTKAFVESKLEQTRNSIEPMLRSAQQSIERGAQQAREVIAPKLEQAQESVQRGITQAKDVVQPRLEQAQDTVLRTAGQAKDAVVRGSVQTKESIVSAAGQVQETVVSTAGDAKESALSNATQAKDSAVSAAGQAKKSVARNAEQAKDILATNAAQAKESIASGASQAKDTLVDDAQQVPSAIKPKLEQARQTASQTAEQITEPVVRAAQQYTAPPESSVLEAATGHTVLEQSGPDLNQSVVPVEDPSMSVEFSSANLAESGVVVDAPGLSQSTVVVDAPSDISKSILEAERPRVAAPKRTAVDQASSAAPPPDFESAWTKALANEDEAKSPAGR